MSAETRNVMALAARAPCGPKTALKPPPANRPATVPVWAVIVSSRSAFGYSSSPVRFTRTAERLDWKGASKAEAMKASGK